MWLKEIDGSRENVSKRKMYSRGRLRVKEERKCIQCAGSN
jgi:hypothetical protein